MSKWDKYRKKAENEKKAKEIMDTPVFKEMMKEQGVKATANAIGRLAFITCEFLETRHGYKKAGLKKFLEFLHYCINYAEEDNELFISYEKYFKDNFDLDVLAEIGLRLEVSDGSTEEENL